MSVGSDKRVFDEATAGFFVDRWIMATRAVLGGEMTLATNVVDSFLADGSISYRTVMNMRVVHTPGR